jgi:hypothetical protein
MPMAVCYQLFAFSTHRPVLPYGGHCMVEHQMVLGIWYTERLYLQKLIIRRGTARDRTFVVFFVGYVQ